jgi:hypothetical protein
MTDEHDGGLGWFKPKVIGWGASPATWQGWMVLAAFIAVVAVLGMVLHDHVAPYLVAVGTLTVLLVIFARRNTRGAWRWRSGGEGK